MKYSFIQCQKIVGLTSTTFAQVKAGAGFTLIELLVVVTISVLMVGGGLAAYSSFNERQLVKSAGLQLYNDLRFAQGKASANEKPDDEACTQTQGSLEGYNLAFSSPTTYTVEAICNGVSVPVEVERNFSAGVQLIEGTEVMFYILGKGAEAKSFCLGIGALIYKVNVTVGGEIIDNGFVTSCI